MKEFVEYFPVLCIYLLYILVPLTICGLLEELIVRTKTGRRFEAWLFKKLGINADEDK